MSCMLPGPSLRLVYDFRASSESDSVTLEYNALVHQATGEDWNGVDLKLSTATVNISGMLLELNPWRKRLQFLRQRRKSAAPQLFYQSSFTNWCPLMVLLRKMGAADE